MKSDEKLTNIRIQKEYMSFSNLILISNILNIRYLIRIKELEDLINMLIDNFSNYIKLSNFK